MEGKACREKSHLITISIVVRGVQQERSALEIELKSYVCIYNCSREWRAVLLAPLFKQRLYVYERGCRLKNRVAASSSSLLSLPLLHLLPLLPFLLLLLACFKASLSRAAVRYPALLIITMPRRKQMKNGK